MGTIPSETIEQIAAANDIVEVIGSYFPLKRAGANFKALCPFHQEKTPSFTVSPSRQTFHCFGCGADTDGNGGCTGIDGGVAGGLDGDSGLSRV